jgi:CRP-like cAMP-binding protein
MDNRPRYLEYGEETSLPSRTVIYTAGEPVGPAPVLYLVAGLVKVEYPMASSTFSLWLHPDSVFGLVEPLAECGRLCIVQAMERTILYRWDLESFFTAAGVSWELALAATTCMTRELRIMNAAFGQRIGSAEKGSR